MSLLQTKPSLNFSHLIKLHTPHEREKILRTPAYRESIYITPHPQQPSWKKKKIAVSTQPVRQSVSANGAAIRAIKSANAPRRIYVGSARARGIRRGFLRCIYSWHVQVEAN